MFNSIKKFFVSSKAQLNVIKENTDVQSVLENDERVKHSDLFEIVIVLDESGSMNSVRKQMIDSINDFLLEQKQISERPAAFTLVRFSDIVTRGDANVPLVEVSPLTMEDYSPDGYTALYDAVGSTINWFREEKEVLMVIVTDGQENASTKYKKDEVLRMTEEKKTTGWSFVYLSCDLESARQGDGIGLANCAQTTNQVMRQENLGCYMSSNLSKAVGNYRKNKISVQSQLNNQ